MINKLIKWNNKNNNFYLLKNYLCGINFIIMLWKVVILNNKLQLI